MMAEHNDLYTVNAKCYSHTYSRWRRPSSRKKQEMEHLPSAFRLLTWNVDYSSPNPKVRIRTAIDHIQADVFGCVDGLAPNPCVICLQEVSRDAFATLLSHEWVRDHFLVVPTSMDEWPGVTYGVVTLVSKGITIINSQSLAFGNSDMGRNALIVDVRIRSVGEEGLAMSGSGSEYSDEEEEEKYLGRVVTLRVGNTHLESLPQGGQVRPVQLADTAALLKERGIHAGLVCGDMNMILPSDVKIHEQAGLVDAYTGDDEDERGFTWGYQPEKQFPAARLDRMFYTSKDRCVVDSPRRVGVGLKSWQRQWVSDHYGLVTDVSVVG